MVAPLLPLLGILAAGGAARAGSLWLDRRDEEARADNRGRRLMEGVGGLLGDPEASQLDYGKGLLQTGLLGAGDFLSSAFGQENEFLRQMFDTARGRASAEADQAKLLEGRLFDLGQQFQPRFDAISSDMADIREIDRLLADVQGMDPTSFGSWFGTDEGMALHQRLLEAEERDFFRFKNEVYGEAEPPPAVMEQLREVYRSRTGGEPASAWLRQGRTDRARQIYADRLEEQQRRMQELQREYQRNLDRVGLGGVQVRGADLGGRTDVATRSDRNLIQRESGGNWGATNAEGMSGRAQFSPARLDEARRAGVMPDWFTREDFLGSPAMQRQVEDWHFGDIEDFMERQGLDAFEGSRVLGIPVTWQGMINVAHLGGKNGLARFLATRGRYNPADSNGTRLSDYLAMGARGG